MILPKFLNVINNVPGTVGDEPEVADDTGLVADVPVDLQTADEIQESEETLEG